MSKLISFWLLVGVIVVLALVFFRVMAVFMVPLFLAAVLVVIFNPMHRWMLKKLKGRRRIAAALTTGAIMSMVLVPIGLLVTFAILEGVAMAKSIRPALVISQLQKMRTELGLDIPEEDSIRSIEQQYETLLRTLSEDGSLFRRNRRIPGNRSESDSPEVKGAW